MNRVLVSLGASAAVLTAAAVALFVIGGTGATVGGVVLAVVAAVLWMATFGLSRDPEARSVVAQRMAQARGEDSSSAAPASVRSAADEPVVVEAEATQGFTVGGERRPVPQDRRQKQRKRG